jgi:hypothetical protein
MSFHGFQKYLILILAVNFLFISSFAAVNTSLLCLTVHAEDLCDTVEDDCCCTINDETGNTGIELKSEKCCELKSLEVKFDNLNILNAGFKKDTPSQNPIEDYCTDNSFLFNNSYTSLSQNTTSIVNHISTTCLRI